MNISTYIFGKFPSGYAQFPDDFTREYFTRFYEISQSTTQLAVRRKDDLMYYGYIRKIEPQGCYIGLCAVLNGVFIKQPEKMFSGFEHIIETMVTHGRLIHYTNNGEITATVNKLFECEEEQLLINHAVKALVDAQQVQQLPAWSYSVSDKAIKSYSIFDDVNEIEKSTYANGYTMIYKSKNYDTAKMLGYKSVFQKQIKKIKTLQDENDKLQKELKNWKNRQKNTKIVGLLGIIAIVLGTIIWNKVLFPSEVTKYDAGEYLYYGPMLNGKPNGVGVAIYHQGDKDGRLYYYGNFKDGNRKDKDAIMFYKDGSYFKGIMDDDKWLYGIFFDINKTHFIGSFKNNKPSIGTWYEHIPVQQINN